MPLRLVRRTLALHMRYLFLVGSLAAGLLAPVPAWAHVKWFEDATPFPLRTDLMLGHRTLLWLGASAMALLVLHLLARLAAAVSCQGRVPGERLAGSARALLALAAATSLVHAAAQPALFVPNLPLPANTLGLLLAAAQLLIAATFVTGVADWLGALALMALVPSGLLLFTPTDVLEQTLWVGIGATLLLLPRTRVAGDPLRLRVLGHDPLWALRSVAALRIMLGLSLVVLALTEKLWNPGLGRAFLEHRPEFNVFQSLGGMEWFTDDQFVLGIGVVEGTLGVLLLSGLLTRVVVLGLWLPFVLGIPFLGPQELLGHLPVYGILVVLQVHGSGVLQLPMPSQWSASLCRRSQMLWRRGTRLDLATRAAARLRWTTGSWTG